MQDDIKGYETRHVVYCRSKNNNDDMIVVNQYKHLNDGSRIKEMKFFKNFKRDYYIVKKGQRTFEDKKQWVPETMLDRYQSTQANLHRSIGTVLNKKYYSLREAFNSPYVFGCGTTVQSDIKFKYKERWGDCITPTSSVAVVDLETNVLSDEQEIILATITMKEKAFIAVNRTKVTCSDNDFIDRTKNTIDKYLSNYIKERNIEIEIKIVETPGEAAYNVIQKAHQWQPDFVIFWNMDFDLPKIIEALKKEGFNLDDVFSDPRVPKEFRWFNYKPGAKKKMIQNGTFKGIAPYEQWHIANAPATFFMACAMTTYYRLRIAAGKLPGGYGLDATLDRHLNLGKLKFDECDGLTKFEWHVKMQSSFFYEYIAYNLFDCIGVELLDEKNLDFSLKFNTKCTVADYTEFKSAPQLTMVKMNYLVPEYGCRLGVVGDNIRTETDNMVVTPDGWTVVLPAFMIEDSKINVMSDLPNLRSLMYFHVSDSDISSTYPAVQVALNISKSTTTREVVKVQGLDESTKRKFFVDLVSGISSSLSVCNIGFNTASPEDALALYEKEHPE